MYVCLCKGITDNHLKEVVRNGATSFKEVRQSCQVGTQCGKCAQIAKGIVTEAVNTHIKN